MALDLSALDAHLPNGPSASKPGATTFAPLASFEVDPDNPRFEHDPPGFELFLADVRERGILQPLIVRRGDNGKLLIRFGARRYRAAVKLGLATVPYAVTEDARQFDDYSQVAENQHRATMQPLELATFAAKKVAAGDRKNVIAARLGLHPSSLTHLLCLTGEVPAFILELYHSCKCRSPRFLYALRGLWDVAPQVVEGACVDAEEIDNRFVEALSAAIKERDANSARGTGQMTRSGRAEGAMRDAGSVTLKTEHQNPSISHSSNEPPGVHESIERRKRIPQLVGLHGGREVTIEILTPPSVDGMVPIRFVDTGELRQTAAGEVILLRIARPGT